MFSLRSKDIRHHYVYVRKIELRIFWYMSLYWLDNELSILKQNSPKTIKQNRVSDGIGWDGNFDWCPTTSISIILETQDECEKLTFGFCLSR